MPAKNVTVNATFEAVATNPTLHIFKAINAAIGGKSGITMPILVWK